MTGTIPISPGSGVENIILDKQDGKASEAIDDGRMAAHSLPDSLTLQNTLNPDTTHPIVSVQERYDDAWGCRYESVRYCDLDRFRDR
jgi:hypothetical protein